MAGPAIDPQDVFGKVLFSLRYGWLYEPLVLRLAEEEIPKSRNLDDAVKRTKRRLHQIYGAFTTNPHYDRLAEQLRAIPNGDEEALRRFCRRVMAHHASTRERLPHLEHFYAKIFAVTGTPTSILDIGCGLNPLAIPWMGLAPGSTYHAYDIDHGMLKFLDDLFPHSDIDGHTHPLDIVAHPPREQADVALLLKMAPCLEQQREGIALALLRSLNSRLVVITYPTESLGGRNKGMARTYRDHFAALAAELGWPATEVEGLGELVFVLEVTGEVTGDR